MHIPRWVTIAAVALATFIGAVLPLVNSTLNLIVTHIWINLDPLTNSMVLFLYFRLWLFLWPQKNLVLLKNTRLQRITTWILPRNNVSKYRIKPAATIPKVGMMKLKMYWENLCRGEYSTQSTKRRSEIAVPHQTVQSKILISSWLYLQDSQHNLNTCFSVRQTIWFKQRPFTRWKIKVHFKAPIILLETLQNPLCLQ